MSKIKETRRVNGEGYSYETNVGVEINGKNYTIHWEFYDDGVQISSGYVEDDDSSDEYHFIENSWDDLSELPEGFPTGDELHDFLKEKSLEYLRLQSNVVNYTPLSTGSIELLDFWRLSVEYYTKDEIEEFIDRKLTDEEVETIVKELRIR